MGCLCPASSCSTRGGFPSPRHAHLLERGGARRREKLVHKSKAATGTGDAAPTLSNRGGCLIGIETKVRDLRRGQGRAGPGGRGDPSGEVVPLAGGDVGWDYRAEHPRRDMRGFTVDHLSVDPNDAQFEQSGQPHSTDAEVRADRVLPSGAAVHRPRAPGVPRRRSARRSGPDRLRPGGERVITTRAQRRLARSGPGTVALYKNNTDFHGASYGCHESYLISRAVRFEDLLSRPAALLRHPADLRRGGARWGRNRRRRACRTSFAAGRLLLGRGVGGHAVQPAHRQHARDADARRYRRFHVICGDANL